MKKIGILTFHKSLNYGAFMQTYSLYTRLKKEFPTDQVEVIDYTTRRIQRKYSSNPVVYTLSSLWEIKAKTIVPTGKAVIKNAWTVLHNREFLKKRKIMKRAFLRDMSSLKLSQRSFHDDRYQELFSYISDQYDIVVVGSDCVWEINNYPFPNAYYLGEVKNTIKLSYAACAQGVLFQNLSQGQAAYMKKAWAQYSYLGVRDDATERLLKSVDAGLRTEHNCDPTVFLNLDELPVDIGQVKGKLEARGVDFSRPVLGLMGNQLVGKICREIFGDKYQIVALYEENPYADVYVFDLSPFEWAKSFSLFSLVFTNKFHGTLLSLKNGVSPISFDFAASNTSLTEGDTKIHNLYQRLDLMDHYFVGKKTYTDQEKQRIGDQARFLLDNNQSEIIHKALLREGESFEGFRKALQGCLNISKSVR